MISKFWLVKFVPLLKTKTLQGGLRGLYVHKPSHPEKNTVFILCISAKCYQIQCFQTRISTSGITECYEREIKFLRAFGLNIDLG